MIDATGAPIEAHPPVCVLPCLNAELTAPRVVAEVRAALAGVHVVAVDDGSTDGTRAALRACADHVIVFDTNRGKGAGLRAAFAYARDHRPRSPVFTIDADGQHDASLAPLLLRGLEGADIVIGARSINGVDVPAHRRLANRLSSAATRAVTRAPINDSQSGFRALSARVVATVQARGDRYEFETDFLVRAAHLGYRIAEVPIPTIYGPPSHFRELSDTVRVVRVLWSHRAGLFRS